MTAAAKMILRIGQAMICWGWKWIEIFKIGLLRVVTIESNRQFLDYPPH